MLNEHELVQKQTTVLAAQDEFAQSLDTLCIVEQPPAADDALVPAEGKHLHCTQDERNERLLPILVALDQLANLLPPLGPLSRWYLSH